MKVGMTKKIYAILSLLLIFMVFGIYYDYYHSNVGYQIIEYQHISVGELNPSLRDLQEEIEEFVQERDWNKFNNLKNLAMSVSIESAELLEQFLWIFETEQSENLAKNRQNIQDEAADVLISLLQFCNAADIDLATAFHHKLAKTKAKYPVDTVKGKHTKYRKIKYLYAA